MFSSLRITPSCGWPTVTRNQPIRLDGATLQAEIGYDWSARHATPGGAIH
jgi:hypothetical protein